MEDHHLCDDVVSDPRTSVVLDALARMSEIAKTDPDRLAPWTDVATMLQADEEVLEATLAIAFAWPQMSARAQAVVNAILLHAGCEPLAA